ncbi:probable nucleolar protein 5-2 [Lolium perenne]|uniref:probable nucleolar protein 5-2 n=1 Tax=Lolium perenne TaxID=4522 RepID=UPI0021F5245D|nr:probable nucleolar protein 5-2 [Lolium perenne]
MGRRRGHPSPRPPAAIAGSDPPGGPSIPEPTSGVKGSTSRKRQRSGRKRSPSPSKISSTPAESIPSIGSSFGNYAAYAAEILVLFETPSGFAVFSMKEYYLNQQDAMKNIWAIFGEDFRPRGIARLKEFQMFNDKSSAINHVTGVSRELSEMISRYHHPYQTLAVGKSEYKGIIEKSLPGVPCRFDEAVLEVMWGLKNLMDSLVPEEELKLTQEDRLPMSQGLKMFLDRHGFDVKPEMVKGDVVVTACLLYDAEVIENRYGEQLHWAAVKLKDVSGIDSAGWKMMKIATALKIMFDPLQTTDHDMQMFTPGEVKRLERDARKFEDIINEDESLKIYRELVVLHAVKIDALRNIALNLRRS